MAKAFKKLSEAEARKALYIDFEGVTDEAPVLIGILRRKGRGEKPHVTQYVLDRDFDFDPAGPVYMEFSRAVALIVARAERKGRRIVSWSEHDLKKVRSLADTDAALVSAFESRYANGLGLARRWAERLHKAQKPPTGDLENYLDLIGYVVPDEAGPGNVGTTIRAMRKTLRGKGAPMPKQLGRWQDLREHNRYDCAGMRAVCVRAAAALDRDDARKRKPKKRRKQRRDRRP